MLATERYRTGANSPSPWSTPSQNGWVWSCPQQYSPCSVQSSASAGKGVSGARVVDVIIAFLLASWLAGIGGSAGSAALACKGLVAIAPRSKAAPYAREPGLTVRQRTLAPFRACGCARWTSAPRRCESQQARRHAKVFTIAVQCGGLPVDSLAPRVIEIRRQFQTTSRSASPVLPTKQDIETCGSPL